MPLNPILILEYQWKTETGTWSTLLKVRHQQPKNNIAVQFCDRNHTIKLYKITSKDELHEVRLPHLVPGQYAIWGLSFGRGR